MKMEYLCLCDFFLISHWKNLTKSGLVLAIKTEVKRVNGIKKRETQRGDRRPKSIAESYVVFRSLKS